MRPIKGLKKRKKLDKKVYQNVLNLSIRSQPQVLDWWDYFSRRISGPLSQSMDSMKFESVFKISRKTFNYICSLVKENMKVKTSNFRDISGKPLSINDQVGVALRRLSSGESLSSIGNSFQMNQSTVSKITWRFVEAMEECGLQHLHWPSTESEMNEVKSKFEKIQGLPNCCGVIDTTHIVMTLPATDTQNDVWLDREKNCSMIVQAVVDSEMRFCDIISGWPGSLTDSLVLQTSGFFKLSEEGKRLNGKNIHLSKGNELREYIIGDSGFPLLPWLITPYQGKGLSDYESEFNKRLSATQKTASKAFTRLKDTWRIIRGVMWKPDKNKLPRIILVCCLLHNILIDLKDEVQEQIPFSHHHDSGYQQQICDSVDKNAPMIREKLALYSSGKLLP